jgi:SAM-dependent methyltransferase
MKSLQESQPEVAPKFRSPLLCPVCKAPCSGPPTSRYTAQNAATHFCPSYQDPERHQRLVSCITHLWQGEVCEVYHCPDCGFGFGHPFVGGDEAFYGILHEHHAYPAWRWDYDYALAMALPKGGVGSALDIGAGSGAFLKSLDHGWAKFAVEGSPTTRDKLKIAGIQVFDSLDTLANQFPGRFQVITMFQVLEHISSFHEVLTHCQQLLAAGGKLVITVPDARAMQRQEELTGWADMPPNHINKWTPKSLRLALGQVGLTGGHATYEKTSWAAFRGALHLQVLANRSDPDSLSAKVYRIRSRSIRAPLVALLALLALFRLAPHVKELCKGGAFAMVASKE